MTHTCLKDNRFPDQYSISYGDNILTKKDPKNKINDYPK